ncbi:hydrolase, alpha/beta fold family [Pseudonocardia sp. Ae168_Ps1]|uniref:alpha/beta fold hydrolase n=1 Tax=unclassified Pseudonocardia TaxID=2619320 RepID=UPI00094B24C2|nr:MULTISPECIES: alpha/beta hydrolase [unclassified Pseudonocardia]OLL71278.1 hydrolase, alpha/beta fold family [Pseudonocardia sp. Ae168_Ps1]
MERAVVTGGHGLPIGYAEYGPSDGPPVLLLHGLFGSAVVGAAWSDRAERHGVRLIAAERPGYGVSPPAGFGAVADWVPAVAPLLEWIGRPVDVVGISAGAPYAYALAALAPERVRECWVLSGLPYVHDDAMRGRYPQASLDAWAFFRDGDPRDVAARFDAGHDRFAAAFAGHPHLVEALREISGHGWAGPAREAALQVRPWGFTPSDVARPVTVRHSRADDQVPFDAAEATVELLPGGRLVEQVEPGHLPSETSLDAVFAELTRPGREEAAGTGGPCRRR